MASTTIIKQKLTVKKVIGKAQSKFGKASLIVPMNGKDEFLGLNDGVDETAFEAGKTYELELAISKTGKRYVRGIISQDATVAEAPKPAPAKKEEAVETEVVQALDRDTRITLMNIGNVAANLAAGDLDNFGKAFRAVKKLYKEEGVL